MSTHGFIEKYLTNYYNYTTNEAVLRGKTRHFIVEMRSFLAVNVYWWWVGDNLANNRDMEGNTASVDCHDDAAIGWRNRH